MIGYVLTGVILVACIMVSRSVGMSLGQLFLGLAGLFVGGFVNGFLVVVLSIDNDWLSWFLSASVTLILLILVGFRPPTKQSAIVSVG